jgi:hypothetical protein
MSALRSSVATSSRGDHLGLARSSFIAGVEEDARAVARDHDAVAQPTARLVVEVMRAEALAEAEAVGLVVEVDLHTPFVFRHGMDDIAPMRLKLTLEYDGTRFRGWAAQPSLRTVEGVFRDALGWVYGSWEKLAVAGRTDTGVHALGQVASVDVDGGPPLDRAARALNTALPDDVSVIAAEEVGSDFHARHSARGAPLPLPDLAPPDAVAVRADAQLLVPAPARPPVARGLRGSPDRHPRLPRVHADRDGARGLRT